MHRGATRVPRRTCVGCRQARPQDELRRLAQTPHGIRFDPQRRLPGRGAYLCPQPACIDAATRRDAAGLRRALRGGDTEELRAALEALRAEIAGTKQGVRHQVPEGTVRSESA
ncbi:MAG: YlxR family protein [Nitriliruptor sp.]|nr:MAG: YlxR family protein [Nitriliruptor sp.]